MWERLVEYQWEPDDVQPSLLCDEPPTTGDERWDALMAALAEHLAAQRDLAAPEKKTLVSAGCSIIRAGA